MMNVAIIGAGPSALVTAKTLLEQADKHPHFRPHITIFESQDAIGGTFRYRSYSNATLVSSKQLTSFSDFRLPLEHHDHLTLPEYVRYLEDYTAHFQLRERCHFRFNTTVTSVTKVLGGHLVKFTANLAQDQHEPPSEQLFTHLCVCSGLHVIPAVPEIPGLPPRIEGDQLVHQQGSASNSDSTSQLAEQPASPNHIETTGAQSIITLHSSQYKDRSLYKGKRVMILGTGETGMDMAYEAVKGGAKEIVLCTRAGFLMFPAVLADFVVLGSTYDGNLPIDGLITNLFETAYVHPWIAASHLRWFVSDFVIKRVLWLLTGTEAGCNQWVGELEPERLGRAYTFLNKSSKAMPYINRGWKNRSWLWEKLASYLDPPTVRPDEPSVDLAPFPSHLTADGTVVFHRNGRKEDFRMRSRRFRPEVVVYATGYTQNFDFLSEDYPVPATVRCRDVFDPSDPTVSFIGFVRPGVGAIPPIAEMQAQLWTLVIRNQIPPPTSTPHYYLLVKESARIKYGVDYSTYVAQLARDMGSAPSLRQLLWEYGLKVTLIYCFCAAFTTVYRLVGPYRHPDAHKIVETEIYDTIRRRGLMGNLTMGLIPMAFYAVINLTAYLLEKSLRIATILTRPFLVQPHPGRSKEERASRSTAKAASTRTVPRARRFQADYGPVVEQDDPAALRRRQGPASAPAPISDPTAATASTNATVNVPRGKLLRFFALLVGVLTVATEGARANTEIRNFGPILCRADEHGHLASKAAGQLSAQWPILTPSTTPSLFTMPVLSASHLSTLPASRQGAWLTLDLSAGGTFLLPSPSEVSLWTAASPRDRFAQRIWNSLHWTLFRRFTLRLSYAANVPTAWQMTVYTPEEALEVGGVKWRADMLGESVEVPEGWAATSIDSAERGPPTSMPAATETRTTDTADLSHSTEELGRVSIEETNSDVIVLPRRKAFSSSVETDSHLPASAEQGSSVETMQPCPRVYLHLTVVPTGVPIPPSTADPSPARTFRSVLYDLAEATIGSLSPTSTDDTAGQAGRVGSLPIHLTLEPLHLGFVPAVAVRLIVLLACAAALGWTWILPALQSWLEAAGDWPDAAGKRLKAE